MITPVTRYVVACDGCGAQWIDEDSDRVVLLPVPELGVGMRGALSDTGWIVAARLLCPPCVQAEAARITDAFPELLAPSLSMDELPGMGDEDLFGGAS